MSDGDATGAVRSPLVGDVPPLRYLSRRDIESLRLTAADLAEQVRDALIGKSGVTTSEAPPKVGVHPRPSTALHAATGYLASADAAGIKWISRYPDNPAAGLDVCAGLCIVNDSATGIPVAVLDASWITEARTAAATATAMMAARPHGVAEVALLGFGAQGVAHLHLLPQIVPGLQRIRVLTRHPDQVRLRLAGQAPDIEVVVADTAEQALRGVSAVVSALPMRQPATPMYDAAFLDPDALIVAVDFDAAWRPSTVTGSAAFVVDDVAQYRSFRAQGWFVDYPKDAIDVADILTGHTSVPSDGLVTITMMGVGLEDVAVSALVCARADEAGVGTILER